MADRRTFKNPFLNSIPGENNIWNIPDQYMFDIFTVTKGMEMWNESQILDKWVNIFVIKTEWVFFLFDLIYNVLYMERKWYFVYFVKRVEYPKCAYGPYC